MLGWHNFLHDTVSGAKHSHTGSSDVFHPRLSNGPWFLASIEQPNAKLAKRGKAEDSAPPLRTLTVCSGLQRRSRLPNLQQISTDDLIPQGTFPLSTGSTLVYKETPVPRPSSHLNPLERWASTSEGNPLCASALVTMITAIGYGREPNTSS